MERTDLALLQQQLAQVPAGTILQAGGQQMSAQTDGRGRMEEYPVWPGVQVRFLRLIGGQAGFHHSPAARVLEVFHCRAGRVGWNMQDGAAVYLGAGDLTVHSSACCADSRLMFPLGYAAGISVAVDLDLLAGQMPPDLRRAGLDPAVLCRRYCTGPPVTIGACGAVDAIFAPLYSLPEPRRPVWLGWKMQELLLYLYDLPRDSSPPARWVSRQTEQIRQIEQLLTSHLDRRFTIEELSRRYLINTSTLKDSFKAVYGLPIATYMKEYRMRRAMELLRQSDASIADIAAAVGYESQGKFARAFSGVVGVSPSAYRRQSRRQD